MEPVTIEWMDEAVENATHSKDSRLIKRTVSAMIINMAERSKRQLQTSAETTSVPTSSKKLDELYARLEKTQPGSTESKQISEQIINSIG